MCFIPEIFAGERGWLYYIYGMENSGGIEDLNL